MNPFVIYYTKTGNTKKIAEAIAKPLDTKAHNVKGVKEVPKGAFLVVGSGVYGGKAGNGIIKFLEDIPEVESGKAAVFETSGDGRKMVAGEQMKWILKKKGYIVRDSFVCPGTMFKIIRRGYPKPEHLEQAMKFAEGLKK